MADTPVLETSASTPLAEPSLKPLTPRQRFFVKEYICDLNATKAAMRVGYAPDSAGVTGAQLLSYPSIRAAIKTALEARAKAVGITAETILAEMSAIAESNADHYEIDVNGDVKLAPGAPPNAMAAIRSIRKRITHLPEGGIEFHTEVTLWDKPTALKLMGKHAGIESFSDRVEVTGKGGGPVEIAAMKVLELSTEDLQKKVAELTSGIVVDAIAPSNDEPA